MFWKIPHPSSGSWRLGWVGTTAGPRKLFILRFPVSANWSGPHYLFQCCVAWRECPVSVCKDRHNLWRGSPVAMVSLPSFFSSHQRTRPCRPTCITGGQPKCLSICLTKSCLKFNKWSMNLLEIFTAWVKKKILIKVRLQSRHLCLRSV